MSDTAGHTARTAELPDSIAPSSEAGAQQPATGGSAQQLEVADHFKGLTLEQAGDRTIVIRLPGLDPAKADEYEKLRQALTWLGQKYPGEELLMPLSSGRRLRYSEGIVHDEQPAAADGCPRIARVAALGLPSGARAVLLEGAFRPARGEDEKPVLYSLAEGRIVAERLRLLKLSAQGNRGLFAFPEYLDGDHVSMWIKQGQCLSAELNMPTAMLRKPTAG